MTKEYWIEEILGGLYGVKWSDGTYTHTSFEGSYDECLKWIEKNG